MPSVAARVGMAVLGMLLVEQLYRNKPLQERWAIKFACLGIGGMFAYDFYLYSDAMLFRQVNPDIWAARGVVNALTVPLMAISMARSASWSSELAVSRRVMFHSAALFGSAIYLLAMGSAGYYLRYFGGSWGTVMQVAFLFGALMLLVGDPVLRHLPRLAEGVHQQALLQLQLRLPRGMAALYPHPVRARARAWASAPSRRWRRWSKARAARCGSGASRRRSSRPPTGMCRPQRRAEPADSPFCQLPRTATQWVVDLQEYARQPGQVRQRGRCPTGCTPSRARWLVVPLIMQGKLFGFMLLQQPRSPITLNWEVIDLLKIAGSQAASYLAQQEAANALMVARQFESFNRMSTFVVHDLKNLVSQLSLLMPNAEKHKRQSRSSSATCSKRSTISVQKMKLLLQKLSRSESPEHPAPLPIDQVLRQAVALKAAFEPRPVLDSRRRRPEGAGRPRAARARGGPPDPERDRGHAARRQRARSRCSATATAAHDHASPTPAKA